MTLKSSASPALVRTTRRLRHPSLGDARRCIAPKSRALRRGAAWHPHLPNRAAELSDVSWSCIEIVGEAPRLRFVERDEEPAVVLLVDQRVVRRGRAEPVPIDARGPVIGVKPHVVEGGGIRGPHDEPVDIRNLVGEVPAGRKIAHAQRFVFRTVVVGRPGDATCGRANARFRRTGNKPCPSRARRRRAVLARRLRRAAGGRAIGCWPPSR